METQSIVYQWHQIKELYNYLGQRGTKGYRTGAKTMDENEEGYYIEECMNNHGLQTDKVWYQAFENTRCRNMKQHTRYVGKR